MVSRGTRGLLVRQRHFTGPQAKQRIAKRKISSLRYRARERERERVRQRK